ncbi:MAG TPA: dockerin type I repeat-containing protein [Candidatus Limnocylindrales bacterium]|nr:dockerin type I repeat-containing protein [Candidatus Limnocylindrales bacterium]
MNSMLKKVFPAILIAAMLLAIAPSITTVKAQYQSTGDVLVTFPSGTPTTTYAYSAYETTPTSYYYQSSVYTPTPPFSESDPPSAQPAESTPGIVTLPSLPANTEGYYLVQIYGSFSGLATVYVPYYPSDYPAGYKPHLCIGDPVDFTGNGVVNLVDVALMLQAIKMFRSGTLTYAGLEEFDLNHDGVVNFADLQIVLQYLLFGLPTQGGRLPWIDITVGWTEINGYYYVVGVTDHFSIFGVH